ncbi:MAG: hypothetical protein BWX47_00536 [candidate division Hyd24-12 bacterium ADurb.Bin004]|jgi:hypothetical protein|nr:MAG: hypothetical protein BWX47_00536 [candidate division Hyd24-12 bacterium ADurb.Bin004]
MRGFTTIRSFVMELYAGMTTDQLTRQELSAPGDYRERRVVGDLEPGRI